MGWNRNPGGSCRPPPFIAGSLRSAIIVELINRREGSLKLGKARQREGEGTAGRTKTNAVADRSRPGPGRHVSRIGSPKAYLATIAAGFCHGLRHQFCRDPVRAVPAARGPTAGRSTRSDSGLEGGGGCAFGTWADKDG